MENDKERIRLIEHTLKLAGFRITVYGGWVRRDGTNMTLLEPAKVLAALEEERSR